MTSVIKVFQRRNENVNLENYSDGKTMSTKAIKLKFTHLLNIFCRRFTYNGDTNYNTARKFLENRTGVLLSYM